MVLLFINIFFVLVVLYNNVFLFFVFWRFKINKNIRIYSL